MSDVTKIHLYPLVIATIAKPKPVFPEVPSMIVPPGFNKPLFSASIIIFKPILSFTEFPGLKVSYFAKTLQGSSFVILFRTTIGVFPIDSVRLSKYSI